MTFKKSIFSIFFLFVSIVISGQNIINVTEKDRNGKYLNKDGTFKDGYTNNKIVDINSVLQIDLDKDKILREVDSIYGYQLPADLASKLKALNEFIKNRNKNLSKISAAINNYDYEKFKDEANRAEFEKNVQILQESVDIIAEIKKVDERINELFRTNYSFYTGSRYEKYYQAAADVIPLLEEEIEEFTNENGIYFQFGGWLYRNKETIAIHFPGFDDIAPQEAYEVDRWQFLPSPKQLDELKEIQKLAKENVDKGLNILEITAKKQLEAIKSFGTMELNNLLKNVTDEITRVKSTTTAPDDVLSIMNEIESLQAEINSFKAKLDLKLANYNSLGSLKEIKLETFLTQAKIDIDFIKNDGQILLDRIDTIGNHFKKLQQDVINSSGEIKPLFEKLKSEYANGFISIKSSAQSIFESVLKGSEVDIAALEFGENVYKLAFTDIPESTDLDLVTTGMRSEGDRLALKMIVAGKDNKKHMLESKEIYMFKVLTHVESTVGVIFADPFTPTNISTTFQMAPCYNLLFKGLTDQKARRRSIAYNRLFDWGFGLHVSAPDFNKDDVPEIGFGVVVSCLNDYLQTGVAYNVFAGVPYWFFGCRIPIPTFNSGISLEE